jgi:hypothetical protein
LGNFRFLIDDFRLGEGRLTLAILDDDLVIVQRDRVKAGAESGADLIEQFGRFGFRLNPEKNENMLH